jgi:Cupin
MLLFEMQSPSQGSAVMVARILDLLFIQILRAWATGWPVRSTRRSVWP